MVCAWSVNFNVSECFERINGYLSFFWMINDISVINDNLKDMFCIETLFLSGWSTFMLNIDITPENGWSGTLKYNLLEHILVAYINFR